MNNNVAFKRTAFKSAVQFIELQKFNCDKNSAADIVRLVSELEELYFAINERELTIKLIDGVLNDTISLSDAKSEFLDFSIRNLYRVSGESPRALYEAERRQVCQEIINAKYGFSEI